jgi:hypothetical protein
LIKGQILDTMTTFFLNFIPNICCKAYFRLHLFCHKMIYKKCFSYFECLVRRKIIVNGKYFSFSWKFFFNFWKMVYGFQILNHFRILSILFSNLQIMPRLVGTWPGPIQDLIGTCLKFDQDPPGAWLGLAQDPFGTYLWPAQDLTRLA